MTGQINVNKIAARSGNTITINSGDKISGDAGSIIASGQVIQVKNFQTGAVVNTSGSTMPTDDTILESDEGTEFLSLAITPKSASSKLLIQIVVHGSANDSSRQITGGLFKIVALVL